MELLSLWCRVLSCEKSLAARSEERQLYSQTSDISRKKKQNFAGFSGVNSRKNRPISRDFRGKKVKIRGTIGRFRAIFVGEKSKYEKNRPISRDFSGKKSIFVGFSGQILTGKSADFKGNFGGKLRQGTISKKQPISLGFFYGKFR